MHNERRKKREAHSAKLKLAKLKHAKIIKKMLSRYDVRRAQETGENYHFNWNANNSPVNIAYEEAFNNIKGIDPFWRRSTKLNRNRNGTKRWWFW